MRELTEEEAVALGGRLLRVLSAFEGLPWLNVKPPQNPYVYRCPDLRYWSTKGVLIGLVVAKHGTIIIDMHDQCLSTGHHLSFYGHGRPLPTLAHALVAALEREA